MIRPLFIIFLGLATGELFSMGFGTACKYILIICILAMIIYRILRHFSLITPFPTRYRSASYLLIFSFFCGLFIFQLACSVQIGEKEIDQNTHGKLSGKIERIQFQEEKEQYKILLKRSVFQSGKNQYRIRQRILVYFKGDARKQLLILPGDQILFTGEITFPEVARNPGSFDQKNYYRAQGIYCLYYADTYQLVKRPGFSLPTVAYLIKIQLDRIYQMIFDKEEAALLKAMVLGDKSDLTEETKKLYEENGVAHLLAVSGLHISIVGGRIYRFLRKCKRSYGFSCMAAMMVLAFYGIMTGFGTSVLRAFLMFLIFLGAEYWGRDYDMISSMSLAGILMLLEHPYRICEGGFLISFSAIFAIGMVLPFMEDIVELQEERRRREGHILIENKIYIKIRSQFLASLGLYAITTPIIMLFFFENTPYCVILNPIILPLMPVLMILSIMTGIFGLLAKYTTVFFYRICIVTSWPVSLILKGYKGLFSICRHLPGALLVTGCPSVLKILGIYLLEALILYCCYRGYGKGAFVTSICLMVLFIYQPKDMRIIMLDVGQGQCILVESPEGYTALIDAGSTSEKNVWEFTIKPALSYYGIRKIDYMIVSHTDEDHVSAVRQMLEEDYPVGYLITASMKGATFVDLLDDTWDQADLELFCQAKEKGVDIALMDKGDQLHLGSVILSCVYPYQGIKAGDKNDRSLVLALEYQGFRALFMGDLTSLYEESVSSQRPGPIQLLIVGHHGSKYSTSSEFLQKMKPAHAWISVGRKNFYGHPHSETISRLEKADCQICRTDQDGGMILQVIQGSYHIKSWILRYPINLAQMGKKYEIH